LFENAVDTEGGTLQSPLVIFDEAHLLPITNCQYKIKRKIGS